MIDTPSGPPTHRTTVDPSYISSSSCAKRATHPHADCNTDASSLRLLAIALTVYPVTSVSSRISSHLGSKIRDLALRATFQRAQYPRKTASQTVHAAIRGCLPTSHAFALGIPDATTQFPRARHTSTASQASHEPASRATSQPYASRRPGKCKGKGKGKGKSVAESTDYIPLSLLALPRPTARPAHIPSPDTVWPTPPE